MTDHAKLARTLREYADLFLETKLDDDLLDEGRELDATLRSAADIIEGLAPPWLATLFSLRIKRPADWLTLNAHGTRGSRHTLNPIKQAWKDATAWSVRGQLRGCPWWPTRPLPPCRLEWIFCVGTIRRRDPDNFVLTRKPILDQLVAEGLWPDDNPDWITNAEISFSLGALTEGVIIHAYER